MDSPAYPIRIAIAFHGGRGHTAALAEAVGAGAGQVPAAEVSRSRSIRSPHRTGSSLTPRTRSSSARRRTWAPPQHPSTPSPRRPANAGSSADGRTSWRPASPTRVPWPGTSPAPWATSARSPRSTACSGSASAWPRAGTGSTGANSTSTAWASTRAPARRPPWTREAGAVHKSDLATAEHLGRRVAELDPGGDRGQAGPGAVTAGAPVAHRRRGGPRTDPRADGQHDPQRRPGDPRRSRSADSGPSPTSLAWIVGSYSLVLAAASFAGGALADRHGPRRILIAGLTLLAAASLAAAFCTDAAELIVCRGFMGAGGALITPATLAIVVHSTTRPTGPGPSRSGPPPAAWPSRSARWSAARC
jgi:hypothetical protein